MTKNELSGSLNALVSYQDGTVVSRIINEAPGGTITLFAFDDGQGLSEHTSPFEALVLIIEGELEITLAGRPYVLNQGEVLLMPANAPHALSALHRTKMLLVMLKI